MTNNANKKHRANNLENKKNDMTTPDQRKGNSENPPSFENHAGKPIK